MVKGRKPLATATKRASGAFIPNPSRENKKEPIPTEGKPTKPAHIAANPYASGYWDHAVEQLHQMKILSKADRSVLEAFAEAMAMKRTAFECMDVNVWKKAVDSCRLLMVELGLTPSARSRLVVKDKEEEDAFTAWQKGLGIGDN